MLPQHLNLEQGDKVVYRWRDPHNAHTVGFPATPPNVAPALPEPFGPEFEQGEPPEVVGDPGTSAPGSLLTTPNAVVDAGLRIGTAYHVEPTSQVWSVRTNASTAAATFVSQSTVHDFMVGTLNVQK